MDSLTKEHLNKLFSYDPKTGVLTRNYLCNGVPPGKPVGKKDHHGHLRMHVPGSSVGGAKEKTIGVHRVIWIMVHGFIPAEMVIDHINHIPSDNRLENLRCVTRLQNQRNLSRSISNRTGVSGVQFEAGFWRARLHIFGLKNFYLGSYDTKAEAVAARRAAEIVLGYHANHGNQKVAP